MPNVLISEKRKIFILQPKKKKKNCWRHFPVFIVQWNITISVAKLSKNGINALFLWVLLLPLIKSTVFRTAFTVLLSRTYFFTENLLMDNQDALKKQTNHNHAFLFAQSYSSSFMTNYWFNCICYNAIAFYKASICRKNIT